jgi:hypothetical protein
LHTCLVWFPRFGSDELEEEAKKEPPFLGKNRYLEKVGMVAQAHNPST